MKNCSKCGANLEDNSVFCNSCGKRLIKKESSGVNKVILAIIFVVLLLGTLAIGIFVGRKMNSDSNVPISESEVQEQDVVEKEIIDSTDDKKEEVVEDVDTKEEETADTTDSVVEETTEPEIEEEIEAEVNTETDSEEKYTYVYIGDEVREKEGIIYSSHPDIYNFSIYDDNDSGMYAPDQELEVGKSFTTVRFLKEYPRDIRIIDSRRDGYTLEKVTYTKYLENEKAFTLEQEVDAQYYGLEYGNMINISSEFLQTLEQGIYTFSCYQVGVTHHVSMFYLVVHEEGTEVDNFRLHLLNATQFYSTESKNDVILYIMNTPCRIESIIMDYEALDEDDYDLVYDGYGVVFHPEFLEQYTDQVYITILIKMENGKKVEAKIVNLNHA